MTTTRRAPRQPAGLGDAGRELWRSIVPAYQLRADELRVLADACRVADACAELEDAKVGQPLVTRGSMGQEVISPYVMELRQQRAQLAALLRQLRLPDEPSGVRSSATSDQARKAAAARWSRRG